MTIDTVSQLISVIERQAAQKSGPYIVAIDGKSGTGKSTLAAQLQQRIQASIIEGDDFFAGGVIILESPASEMAEICIDWRSQRDVVRTLLSRGAVSYFPFDWNAFDGTKSSVSKRVQSEPFVILEGVYSARPELLDLVNYSLLIEAPEDLRISRLMHREVEIGSWERQWHRAEDWYFENRSCRRDFDAVLNWVSNHECSLALRGG